MENRKFTFKELLSHKKVEIPILQRDYVQGNLNDKKAISVRLDFVEDLITHLSNPNAAVMPLDFIYGKLIDDDLNEDQERKKEQLSNLLDTVSDFALKNGFEVNRDFKSTSSYKLKDTFVPFDGQQRLTTLFILHFLVYAKQGRELSFLHQFTYKTRVSSRDFLETLLANHTDFRDDLVWKSSFVDFIKDRNWFYDFWKYDPTVNSMLVMMETFREKLQKFDNLKDVLDIIYFNLDQNNAICFDYLDIDEHNLDDILYVKMNASGKELTDFEKFKSWLIEFTENPSNNIQEFNFDWESKLDTNWYDIFWEVDGKETDTYLYQFINKLLAYRFCCTENNGDTKEQQRLSKLVYHQLSTSETVSFRFYSEHKLITHETLSFIWNNLNMFDNTEYYHQYENCIRKVWNSTFINNWHETTSFKSFVIKNIGNFNLFQQAFVFAIFHYIDCLITTSKDFNENDFLKWLRIIRNLIYNSRLDEDVRFFSAIQSIFSLGDKCLELREHVTDEKFIDFFVDRQRTEEFEKNKEIFNHWQEDFIIAENHTYFYGQIGFLIELSKIDTIPNLDRFRYLSKQLSHIFSDENLKGDFLVSRSLLTINDHWLPDYGSCRRLLCLSDKANARERDENWRRVFNDENNRYVLVELANLFSEISDLKHLINSRKVEINDWRRLLLDFPNELNYCKQGLINISNNNYVRLLGQSRLSHYHRELRSSVLFNQFLKDEFSLAKDDYKEMKIDDDCYIEFPLENKKIIIYFTNSSLDFRYDLIENEVLKNITKNEVKLLNYHLFEQLEKMKLYLSNHNVDLS